MTHWTDHERRRLLAEAERLDHEHTNAPGASSLPGAAGAGVSALSPASAPDLRHGTLGLLMSPRRRTANCPIPPRNRFGRDRHDDSDGVLIAALVVIAAIALPVLGGLLVIAHMWGI